MHTVHEAIQAIKDGKIIILVDDPKRENEGDFIIAAEKVTPEAVNFMAKYGRGLICLAMEPKLIDRLHLPAMTVSNKSSLGTAFTVSIEASTGVTTGISASDRARTIQVAVADDAKPTDVISPGHIFPLRAAPYGVLQRFGQTEGSVDLSKLAGLKGAAVICEIMNDDGSMARDKELKELAKTHDLKMISVCDLIDYRNRNELWIEKISEAAMPVKNFGSFQLIGFRNPVDHSETLALVKGPLQKLKNKQNPPLVRVHSECLTGEVFHSERCDCGQQLDDALERIHQEGSGILIYHRAHEGRGIGLLNKIKAYDLQDQGLDTVEANLKLGFDADLRDYTTAAQVLRYLNVYQVRLLTNNPAKIASLEKNRIQCTRVSIEQSANPINIHYLQTKKLKLDHQLETIK